MVALQIVFSAPGKVDGGRWKGGAKRYVDHGSEIEKPKAEGKHGSHWMFRYAQLCSGFLVECYGK